MRQKRFLSDFPDLVKQIHPTRNGEIDPSVILAGSKRKIWWIIYHWDKSKKKTFIFEWEASIANRTILGAGCPFTTGRKVFEGYNDLYSNYPEFSESLILTFVLLQKKLYLCRLKQLNFKVSVRVFIFH